ncbi:MAG: hypothetical protein Q7S14_03620 [bacterium]|nr:hypothetical protein [bacterium]
MDFSPLLMIFILGISFAQFILIFFLLDKSEKPTDKTQEKSQEIIHTAIGKAQEIIGEAEIEGIKTTAEAKFRTTTFERDYEEKLAAAVEKSQEQLEKMISGHIKTTMDGFDLKLAQTIAKIEDDRLKSAAVKADEAKAEIDKYREDITAKVDANIADILEIAIFKITGKKLTLKDHMEIVYDCLEKAKDEKLIS